MVVPGNIGVRWTIGNASDRGFQSLQLSIWGVWRLLGPDAFYQVCVDTISLERAKALTGDLPDEVQWQRTEDEISPCLQAHGNSLLNQGVGSKLLPLRIWPERHEISLDNACIIWDMPEIMRHWLSSDDPHRCLLLEDVQSHFGRFAGMCGRHPRNSAVRGLPPGFDIEKAFHDILDLTEEAPVNQAATPGEFDEQGLQVAAVSLHKQPAVVPLQDITICSPFWPQIPKVGRCGGYFANLNAPDFLWDYLGRPAGLWMDEHWRRHLPMLHERVGLHACDVAELGVMS